MEINVSRFSEEEIRYQKVKKKVRHIHNFYINLSFFVPILIAINLYFVADFHWFWFSILGWRIGRVFQELAAFECNPLLRNNWENRKLAEFMKEYLERE
jgi:hypothetical protein